MNVSQELKYNVVDLFSGAGGLSYGFLQTGRFSVKAAFENNKYAQKTYAHNHKNAVIYNDVAEVLRDDVKKKLGAIDIVIGGPPCQGFSNANRQKNHAVSKNNSLVKKFVQAVLHLDPLAFVMENVSMLKSDVHRFYVDETDVATVEKYGIKTQRAEIILLDQEFVFEGIVDIVSNKDRISRYLWDERDYLSLNIVFKMRSNAKKLCESLDRHKQQLLRLADRLTVNFDETDVVLNLSYVAGEAIHNYFMDGKTLESAKKLCEAIMPVIMLQRMFSKAKEILDNKIQIDHYSADNGLIVHVRSMAVIDYIEAILGAKSTGYSINYGVLSAAAFGAPQKRMRFVLMGIKKSICADVKLPIGVRTEDHYRTVKDAIKDLENVEAATDVSVGNKGVSLEAPPCDISELGKQLRNSPVLYNHVSTATTEEALRRFMAIKQGDNFHSLPPALKTTYSDAERTQNTIYLRLKYDEPSGTVVNVRKSMWIHPVNHRALSIREAARLQTFPDDFVFCGTKDSQYQQVGNAVPPILAKAIAEHLCGYLDANVNSLK